MIEIDEQEQIKVSNFNKKGLILTKTSEELLKDIKTHSDNEILLKHFLKYNRVAYKKHFDALFERFEYNLIHGEESRKRAEMKWIAKRKRLKKINPQIELSFNFKPLTREMVIEHPCYQIIKSIVWKKFDEENLLIPEILDYLSLFQAFERGLENNNFELVYQKLSDLNNEKQKIHDLGFEENESDIIAQTIWKTLKSLSLQKNYYTKTSEVNIH